MNRSEAGKIGRAKSELTLQKRWAKFKDDYYINPKKCKYCDKILNYEDRKNNFCSHTCAGFYHNKARLRPRPSHFCEGCNKEVVRGRNNRYNLFCDDCIKNGKHIRHRKEATEDCKDSTTVRRVLLKKRPHQCEECKNTEWNNKPIPIQVDHIDGNYMNNLEDNLRLLCPNCHAQTPTFGIKNKGHGREYRRRRYAEGKSR